MIYDDGEEKEETLLVFKIYYRILSISSLCMNGRTKLKPKATDK